MEYTALVRKGKSLLISRDPMTKVSSLPLTIAKIWWSDTASLQTCNNEGLQFIHQTHTSPIPIDMSMEP